METRVLFQVLGFKVNITKEAFLVLNRYNISQTILNSVLRYVVNEENHQSTTQLNVYYVDQDILFCIEKMHKDFIITSIVPVDIANNTIIRKGRTPEIEINDPTFFKSTIDNKKIFLNRNVIKELRRLSLNPQTISINQGDLTDGYYTLFDSKLELLIHFYVEEQNVLILQTTALDYIKSGIALTKTKLKKLAQH